jgi:hypothetical protein
MTPASRVPAKAEILLLVASMLIAFGLLEIAARRGFMLPYNPQADGWWEVGWLKRRAEYDSQRAQYAIDKFDPMLGWTLRENLRDVPLDQVRISSNSQGARGRREYSVAKGPGTRVVVIGDSYTFGEGVNDAQTFSAGLEQLLEGEVINLGVHGYGTDQQWLRLRRDGLKYAPDVVVLGFYEDDIARNRLRFRDYLKPHFSIVDGRPVPDNLPLPSPEEFKSRVHWRSLSYLNILLTNVRDRQLEEENVRRSKVLLNEIFAAALAARAQMIQLYLPTPDQVHANESVHPGLYAYGCGVPGVTCVDPTAALHRAIAPYAEDWKPLFRYHYAPELHRVIAGELARAIQGRSAR